MISTDTRTIIWIKEANWNGGYLIATKARVDMFSVVRAIRGRSVLDRERRAWVVFSTRENLVACLEAAGYLVRESVSR